MSDSNSVIGSFTKWRPIQFVVTKIRNKLLVSFLAVALVPLILSSTTLYRSSSSAVMDQAFAQLEAVKTIKANQTQQYFQTIQDQIITFSEDRMIVDAMNDFPEALTSAREENEVTDEDLGRCKSELKSYYTQDFAEEYFARNNQKPAAETQLAPLDDDSLYLQSLYIKNNPNPLGSKELLDRANDKSRYSQLHGQLHPVVRSYLNKFGYYDIFLCDLESGDIVYSVFKELDFTTSLKHGPYANTNFGRAFSKAAEATSPNSVFLVDYEPYTPSYEDAASFISSPIFDGDKKIGVAIFQMPIDRINAIMAERTGLGESGETYAVGADKLFRNDSRFLDQLGVKTTIINKSVPVNTEAFQDAIAGNSGTKVIDDYRGAPVLSSWSPVTVYDGMEGSKPITWALMSEIDLAEVQKPLHAMAFNAWLLVIFAGAVVFGVSLLLSRNLTRQVNSIMDMLGMIGMGDFTARTDVTSQDEMGSVAGALNAMCDNTLSLIQSQDERDQIEASIRDLTREMEVIAQGDLTIEAEADENVTKTISSSVNHMIDQLRRIVSDVKNSTLQVSSSANQIKATAEHLSRGSEAQSAQIVDTSSAIDEMAVSIQQVAENTSQSADVANEARSKATSGASAVADTIDGMGRIRDQVQETSKRIKRLGESSQEIGEIVQLISDIADRTSILALNASIQAAMAGDAGQGFAVVAEEVERLADRSNDATKQITSLIKSIQTETSEATAGMEECTREVVEGSKLAAEAGQGLKEIEDVSDRLANLINSISMATKQQARGAEAVSESMNEISEVTQQTATGTKQTAVSVSHLAGLADGLRESVSQFKLPEGFESEAEAQKATSSIAPVSVPGGMTAAPVSV